MAWRAGRPGRPFDLPCERADTWPLFRGNTLATGVVDGSLPEKLEVLWKFQGKEGGFEATAVIDEELVYVGSLDGNFYAIDRATGDERWKYHTELGFSAAAAVAEGRVYVGDTDGKFYAFSTADGALLWGFEATAEINSAPNFYKNLVLFGSQDATLYALDAATGKLAWKYAIGDQIRCSPTVVDGRAMVAGCDGKLHIIRLDDGKEIGDVVIDSPTGSTPAALGDQVFFGTEGGTFFAIDWRGQSELDGQGRARAVDPLVGGSDRGAGHRRCPRQTRPCFPSVRRQGGLEFSDSLACRFVSGGGRRAGLCRLGRRPIVRPGPQKRRKIVVL